MLFLLTCHRHISCRLRFNSDDQKFKLCVVGGAEGAGGDEVFWENDQTITTNYSITNGKNAVVLGL